MTDDLDILRTTAELAVLLRDLCLASGRDEAGMHAQHTVEALVAEMSALEAERRDLNTRLAIELSAAAPVR